MANLIKIRRGLKENLPAASVDTLGELRYATDTNELYIDNGYENKLINQEYIDTKVAKTDKINQVYTTDNTGNQSTTTYSSTNDPEFIVQRDSNAQINVPESPTENTHATSKKYVDDELSLKPDIVDLADVAYSGSYTDLLDVPTYKTINSEEIIGTGDIKLQTPLSGTKGNVVIYTDTTGILSELGFDDVPTQNSGNLIKSGPVWSELYKKINYTDVKNDLISEDIDKPLSAYQGKILDNKIKLAQQSTHDRGVVQNALLSQGKSYTISSISINNGGSNYTAGDVLILPDLIDAILNVVSVNESGTITEVTLSQGGRFSEINPTVGFLGGTGTGALFDVVSELVDDTTLNSIINPQINDFATVLNDELHDGLRYVWKYVDVNGDGSLEWVSGYPITDLERDFTENPIKNNELGNNSVTTEKIVDNSVTTEKIVDNAIISQHITPGTITNEHVANTAEIEQTKIKDLPETLNTKVTRTDVPYQLYGTALSNIETTLTYTTSDTELTIVQRDQNKQINVALTPTNDSHVTSKKYVNDQDNLKVDKVYDSSRIYGTDVNGNQTTYDYNLFGKIDDVLVGDKSVVENKIAILGTIASKNVEDYTKVIFVDWS